MSDRAMQSMKFIERIPIDPMTSGEVVRYLRVAGLDLNSANSPIKISRDSVLHARRICRLLAGIGLPNLETLGAIGPAQNE